MEKTQKLKEIISSYTPDGVVIDLDKSIKDRYVSNEFKFNFCNDICNQWPYIDCTELTNKMFVDLKTGNDILDYINS